MASRESSSSRPAWAKRRVIIAGAAAVALAVAGTATALATHHSGAGAHSVAGSHAGTAKARLAAASCQGPAFDAVNTANCDLVQQYNVGDHTVPNSGTTDFEYDSTDEGVAISNDTLYFADTGNDTVAVINAADLDSDNYEFPPQILINVGQDPENLAVTPDGSQVWVVTVIGDLGNPEGVAVSPDGTVYVTNTVKNLVDVISPATDHVKAAVRVGELPWQLAISSDGSRIYVADGDSNAISVISAASGKVTSTISDPGDRSAWR
jgi:YVTN family beta-propeller protein